MWSRQSRKVYRVPSSECHIHFSSYSQSFFPFSTQLEKKWNITSNLREEERNGKTGSSNCRPLSYNVTIFSFFFSKKATKNLEGTLTLLSAVGSAGSFFFLYDSLSIKLYICFKSSVSFQESADTMSASNGLLISLTTLSPSIMFHLLKYSSDWDEIRRV